MLACDKITSFISFVYFNSVNETIAVSISVIGNAHQITSFAFSKLIKIKAIGTIMIINLSKEINKGVTDFLYA